MTSQSYLSKTCTDENMFCLKMDTIFQILFLFFQFQRPFKTPAYSSDSDVAMTSPPDGSDILLTLEEAQEMLEVARNDLTTNSRRKRKVSTTDDKWELPIKYLFDGKHST